MIINVKGEEATINSTASTFDNATCVRVYAAANTLVTIVDPVANVTVGSATVLGNSIEYFEKKPSDTIEANIAQKAVSVGFTIS
jgi:hypothetical protein